MIARFDPSEFRTFLSNSFPFADPLDFPINFGPVHLRFELGDSHPNGSEERIAQATLRAATIFEDVFSQEEQLTLIIKDWATGEVSFPTFPGYLTSLIGKSSSERFVEVVNQRGLDDECSYEQVLLTVLVRDLDYHAILRGIVHREQGRKPRINEAVYFISTERALVFYMYDDRGCLVYADHPEKIGPLYLRRTGWLVNPAGQF